MDALPIYALLLVLLQAVQGLKLPKSITKEAYCGACEAMVKDISPKLKKKSLDPLGVRVVEHMEKLCEWSTFQGADDESPQDLMKACQHFMEEHDEQLEQVLYDHFKAKGPQRDLVEYVCKTMSEACVGVVKKPKKKESDKPPKADKDQAPFETINADMSDPEKAAREITEKLKNLPKMPQKDEKDADKKDEKDADKKDEKKEEFEMPKPGPDDKVATAEAVKEEDKKEEL